MPTEHRAARPPVLEKVDTCEDCAAFLRVLEELEYEELEYEELPPGCYMYYTTRFGRAAFSAGVRATRRSPGSANDG